MSSKAQEYLKKHTKIVKAPSLGRDFTICPLSVLAVAKMMSGSRLKLDDFINDPETLPKILQLSIIDPKITLDSHSSNDALSVEKIDNDDKAFLFNEILDLSGLKVEDQEKSKSFADTEIGKMIAVISYTLHTRPSDILDEYGELPPLQRLFFDYGCAEIINNLINPDNKRSGNYDRSNLNKEIGIDKSKIEELKRSRDRKLLKEKDKKI